MINRAGVGPFFLKKDESVHTDEGVSTSVVDV